MSPQAWTMIGTVLAALLGMLGLLGAEYLRVRKSEKPSRVVAADVASTVAAAFEKLTTGLQEDIDRLRNQVKANDLRIAALQLQTNEAQAKAAEADDEARKAQDQALRMHYALMRHITQLGEIMRAAHLEVPPAPNV